MEAAKETVAAALEQIKAALQTHGERLPQTLSDAKLVPGPAAELIPEGFRPTTKLEISYDGKAVDLGNLFRVRETKVQPVISFQREVSHASIQDLSTECLISDSSAGRCGLQDVVYADACRPRCTHA